MARCVGGGTGGRDDGGSSRARTGRLVALQSTSTSTFPTVVPLLWCAMKTQSPAGRGAWGCIAMSVGSGRDARSMSSADAPTVWKPLRLDHFARGSRLLSLETTNFCTFSSVICPWYISNVVCTRILRSGAVDRDSPRPRRSRIISRPVFGAAAPLELCADATEQAPSPRMPVAATHETRPNSSSGNSGASCAHRPWTPWQSSLHCRGSKARNAGRWKRRSALKARGDSSSGRLLARMRLGMLG